MTIKTTSLGPNSAVMSYSINSTLFEIADGISAFVADHGWERIHSVVAASTQTDFYRALQKDGDGVYKYVRITVNSSYIQTEPFEIWDNTAKTASNVISGTGRSTNESQRHSAAFGGYLYMFAHPRWLVLYSKINIGAFGNLQHLSWDGCLEIARDNLTEVPGEYPAFAWSSGGRFVGSSASGSNVMCYYMPRAYGKATQDTDSFYPCSVGTLFGMTASSSPLVNNLPQTVNPIGGAASVALTPYALSAVNNALGAHVRGRFYGIKILTRNFGAPLDKIKIKCDEEYFHDMAGEEVEHFVLTSSDNSRCAIPA